MTGYVHTEKDNLDIVDPEKIARTALALQRLIMGL
jgi:hypothetical protein